MTSVRRIAYLLVHAVGENDGVTAKVQGQADAWRRLGVDVELFVMSPTEHSFGAHRFPATSMWRRFVLDHELIEAVAAFEPDVVYLRYALWSRSLEAVVRAYPSVLELNTKIWKEFSASFRAYPSFGSFARLLAHGLTHERLVASVDGVVGVTQELVDHVDGMGLHKVSAVAPNSIRVDDYEVLERSSHARPALFFMGTPGQSWHGVDLIETWSKALPEFDFHVVGYCGTNSENLTYHGVLRRDEYVSVLRQCDVCLSALALHRKSMVEACPLKVREYVAYGFPIILAHRDPAFDAVQEDWVLCLDTRDEGRVPAKELTDFLALNRGRVLSEKQRSLVDSRRVEGARVDFMSRVVRRSEGG